MIEKLLMMLRDPDYRVRLTLARRIGILFQTWDGHDELFHDIWWDVKNAYMILLYEHLWKLVYYLCLLYFSPSMLFPFIVCLCDIFFISMYHFLYHYLLQLVLSFC